MNIKKDLTGIDSVKCIYCKEELKIISTEAQEGFYCSECDEFMTVQQVDDSLMAEEMVKEPPLKNLMDVSADFLMPGREL